MRVYMTFDDDFRRGIHLPGERRRGEEEKKIEEKRITWYRKSETTTTM